MSPSAPFRVIEPDDENRLLCLTTNMARAVDGHGRRTGHALELAMRITIKPGMELGVNMGLEVDIGLGVDMGLTINLWLGIDTRLRINVVVKID